MARGESWEGYPSGKTLVNARRRAAAPFPGRGARRGSVADAGCSSSPGTAGKVNAAGGEARGKETGKALMPGAILFPSPGRITAYRRAPARGGNVASAKERGRRCGLRAAPGGEVRGGRGGAVSPAGRSGQQRAARGMFAAPGRAADGKALPAREPVCARSFPGPGEIRRKAASPAERHAGRKDAPG